MMGCVANVDDGEDGATTCGGDDGCVRKWLKKWGLKKMLQKMFSFASVIFPLSGLLPMFIFQIKRTTLDERSKRCIFLGVSEESKAYRLYDLVSQKIIVSIDVVLDGNLRWDRKKSHNEAVLVNLEWEENTPITESNENEAHTEATNANNDTNGI
ncbi:retrovirus-related pol polyprotein from transposon TNT 1-94 [Tanacetum coccineum]